MTGRHHPRILQLTDFHLGEDEDLILHGINTAQSLQRILGHLHTHQIESADLLLLTGDLVDQPTPPSYQLLARQFRGQESRCHILPGNHDDPVLMSQLLSPEGFHTDAVVERGNWSILLLNSVLTGSSKGRLRPSTLTWLAETLSLCADRWVLIALHHHPIPSGSAWMDGMMLENADEFLTLISDYSNVRGVIFGHVHQEIDVDLEGIRYLGTPSTCAQFKPGANAFIVDEALPGYRWIELSDDGSIQSTLIRVEDGD